MELFRRRGFEQTTVAEIAERAGLTERTFFRHYADKREVLFGGSDQLREVLVGAVAGAPVSAAPIDAVAAGLEAAGVILQGRRDFARERQQIIAANAELQERELIKLASWARALAEALRRRGADGGISTLTGEVGIAVFRTAFDQWIDEATNRELPVVIRESLDRLNAVALARTQAPGGRARRRPGSAGP
jgi:AcrR family transcriptional regulator